MREATLELYAQSDVVIKAAAVADYRPASISPEKIKKAPSATSIPLEPTDDILALLGREKSRQILVGFAAETENLLPNARRKMQVKNLDMVVANDVSRGVFGEDRASVLILTREGEKIAVENEANLAIAERVLDLVEKLRQAGKYLPDTTPSSGQ
jgi:phosphopantothenoylcysteine decarboxylase/phosphopantothenate--cysteine ligase